MKHFEIPLPLRLARFSAVPFLAFFATAPAHAQQQEDLPKLARRQITAHPVKADSTYNGPHGGAYLGTGSNGRVLPGVFMKYSSGKWVFTGDLTVDISNLSNTKDEEANNKDGAERQTHTDIRKSYEHEDLKFHADYFATQRDILSFDVFEKYRYDRTTENVLQAGTDEHGDPTATKHDEQSSATRDFNFGLLAEYTHKFRPGGSLASRVYFKYDDRPTDVKRIEAHQLGARPHSSAPHEHQSLTSSDPKAQVVYRSPEWGGFSFGVRQKLGLMNMRIAGETLTADAPGSLADFRFNYDVRQSLSSAGADYKHGGLALNVGAGYEIYRHNIVDNVNPDTNHTYRDWLYNASASYAFNKRHRLEANYSHTINRPTYTQLYPFVHIGTSLSSWVIGNPQLQPSVSNQAQGRYTFTSKPITLNAIVTYKSTDDDITRISVYNEKTDRWVKTWVNDATYTTLRFALEGELRLGAFSMTMGAHAQYLHYEGENVTGDRAWSYSFKARPQLQLPSAWTVAVVALYTGREVHLHEYNRGYTYLAFRAQKQLGRWAVYGFVQDVLRSKLENVLENSTSTIVTTTDFNARALILGASYTF